jgi:hypothetical protein
VWVLRQRNHPSDGLPLVRCSILLQSENDRVGSGCDLCIDDEGQPRPLSELLLHLISTPTFRHTIEFQHLLQISLVYIQWRFLNQVSLSYHEPPLQVYVYPSDETLKDVLSNFAISVRLPVHLQVLGNY